MIWKPFCRVLTGIVVCGGLAAPLVAQQEEANRRSQRVRMSAVEVASPDGTVNFRVLSNAERLTFVVTLADGPVLDPSTLAMTLDGYDLSAGVVYGGVERYEIDESYPWWGAHSTAVSRCNGARIALRHDLSFIEYELEIRAFNDGVAYRHIIPGEPGESRAPDEYSTFVIPDGAEVWYHGLGGHYEDTYRHRSVSSVRPGEWSGPPLTFKLPGDLGYGVITEANLVNYAGMALEADGRRGWTIGLGHRQPLNYPYELRYGREEAKRLGQPAAIDGAITTPWRVIMVGRDLNTLVNSTLVPNLCPPPVSEFFPDGLETAWLRQPGRAVWRYLDGGDRSHEGMKAFSRMAGELGFEYHVVEGFWSQWSDEDIQEFVDYSRSQGVGLWFWRHTRELQTPQAREAFFKRLQDFGVVGAKLDFLDHEAKEVVDLYEDLLEQAARRQVALNFHGANKPTGRARTWPNELVREAVRGMESSALQERARHQTILPFTRFLAGHADYTPLHFGQRRGDSSAAHQIATLVVFDSPLLTVAAHPQTILDHPAVEMIKSIPPVWEETIALPDCRIGELVAFARRSGDAWFLAVMCGPEDVDIQVPLAFLGEGQYDALLVSDDREDAEKVRIQKAVKGPQDALPLSLQGGGGFIARFTKP